jgi:hypothetical protein
MSIHFTRVVFLVVTAAHSLQFENILSSGLWVFSSSIFLNIMTVIRPVLKHFQGSQTVYFKNTFCWDVFQWAKVNKSHRQSIRRLKEVRQTFEHAFKFHLNLSNAMDHLRYRLNFGLDKNFITAWKSITKLVIFQIFVPKCCKMWII